MINRKIEKCVCYKNVKQFCVLSRLRKHKRGIKTHLAGLISLINRKNNFVPYEKYLCFVQKKRGKCYNPISP